MPTDVQNLPPELGLYTARMLKAVEDQIVTLAEGTSECLQAAHNAASDLINDTRAGDRQDAVKIAGATALLLQSLAKLKGSYRHDYNIRRASEPPTRPRLKIGWSGRQEDLLTQAEYDALNEFEQEDYELWCAGEPPRFGGWKKKPAPEHVDAASQLEVDALRAEVVSLARAVRDRPPSPLENHGSNKDAGIP
jgi:hypothetical protein